MLHTRTDGTWSLDDPGLCRPPAFHLLLERGRLSQLLLDVAKWDPEYDRILLVWATLGNQNAWWCYSCGSWGVSSRPQRDIAP